MTTGPAARSREGKITGIRTAKAIAAKGNWLVRSFGRGIVSSSMTSISNQRDVGRATLQSCEGCRRVAVKNLVPIREHQHVLSQLGALGQGEVRQIICRRCVRIRIVINGGWRFRDGSGDAAKSHGAAGRPRSSTIITGT